jgi:hypothetical protein
MILRIRRSRGLLALWAVPPGVVWASLVAFSILFHSSGDASEGGFHLTGPHLHDLGLSHSHGRVSPEGPCPACALEGNPAAVATSVVASFARPESRVTSRSGAPAERSATLRSLSVRAPPRS